MLNDKPIEQKLRYVILLTCGVVLFVTCASYFAYEIITFRRASIRELSVLGRILAANNTAALSFDDTAAASETLNSIRAEAHVMAVSLYDKGGKLFTQYPADVPLEDFPKTPADDGYRFENGFLVGFQPVVLDNQRLGTLFIKSDMGAMYDRLQLYSIIALLVIIMAFVITYLLSKRFQKGISDPIISLATTARTVSDRKDYSLRATKFGGDELGELTDVFNHMLEQIEHQNSEIGRFNQKLAETIDERTQELEAANKELEAFSYSVSHDLRAPLRSINGYAKVLVEDCHDKLDSTDMQALEVITRNASKMGNLIDDLLSFSRLGKQNLTKVSLSVESIARGAIEETQAKEEGRKADIHVDPLPDVKGDSSMLRQVFINLISNALKYSRKKEDPRVNIGSYRENGHVVYFVKDNGAGFDMKYYDKLFGVFQRLHNAADFEGTGVGLALVQRIIKKHGGKVWAEGKVDEGATFYFSVPDGDEDKAN